MADRTPTPIPRAVTREELERIAAQSKQLTAGATATPTTGAPPSAGGGITPAELAKIAAGAVGSSQESLRDMVRNQAKTPEITYYLPNGKSISVRYNPDTGMYNLTKPTSALASAQEGPKYMSGSSPIVRVDEDGTAQVVYTPPGQDSNVGRIVQSGGAIYEVVPGQGSPTLNPDGTAGFDNTTGLRTLKPGAPTVLAKDAGSVVLMDDQGNIRREVYDEAAAARAAAQQAINNEHARLRLAIEQGQLSVSQARLAMDQKYNEIRAKLDQDLNQIRADQNKLTQRGQDVDIRGQDINAGVTMRGQNLGFATDVAQLGVTALNNAMQYAVPRGGMADFNKALQSLGSGGYAPVEYSGPSSTPFPYDPIGLVDQIVNHALGRTGGVSFQLPAAPGQVDLFKP